jgi:hypothetical protein
VVAVEPERSTDEKCRSTARGGISQVLAHPVEHDLHAYMFRQAE